MNRYPLPEGVEFSWRCPGCAVGRKTTIPRHGAPFFARCKTEGCEWTCTVQSDEAGISVGHQAPLHKRPDLHLVKGID